MTADEIDWLAACRRVVEAQRQVYAEYSGIAARSNYEGVGEGGDASLVIDRRCEDAVFEELEAISSAGHAFTAISEERGTVIFGDEGDGQPTLVVIDPIDGSLNARRTLPSVSLSIAVASGRSMADVEFAYVYDFGAGEEFTARRGKGAEVDATPLAATDGKQGVEGSRPFEIVGLEAADPGRVVPLIEGLSGKAYRLRAVGSIAISLSYVAAGRFDGLVSARPCRSVDAAAGQLIAREAGGDVAFGSLPLERAALDLDARYPVAAARDPAQLGLLLEAQAL